MPPKNVPHQRAAACAIQGSAGDGRTRSNKRGDEKKWMVLRKEVNSNCAVSIGWNPDRKTSRGRPKPTWRGTAENERQTRMERMDKSKPGRKQPPPAEGRCPVPVRILARRDPANLLVQFQDTDGQEPRLYRYATQSTLARQDRQVCGN